MGRTPSLVSAVLGTAVVVCLWRSDRGYGGLVHYRYPNAPDRRKIRMDDGETAITRLIKTFLDEGAKARHLKAQIFGGAFQSFLKGTEVAKENIRIARMVLVGQRIPILSEDTGGYMGRKLVYSTGTNETLIYRAATIRKEDWYPYPEEGEDKHGT